MGELLIFALAAGLIGAFGYAVSSARRAKLGALAPRLRLRMVRPQVLGGSRAGVVVRLRFLHASGREDVAMWTLVEGEIDPPLRLGLNLRSLDEVRMSTATASEETSLGLVKASFDAQAIDDGELGRFLQLPALRIGLLEARSRWERVHVTDEHVQIWIVGDKANERELSAALDAVVGIVGNALDARRRMGRSMREIELIDSWDEVADTLGWKLDRENLVLTGTKGRARFRIVAWFAPLGWQPGWFTQFRVMLPKPLGLELVLSRQASLSAAKRLFGIQDINIGDDRFDDAFRVQGSDASAVRELLNDELRERLLRLLEDARELRVHDDRVDAVTEGLLVDPGELTSSLAALTEIAELLGGDRESKAPRRGAYR